MYSLLHDTIQVQTVAIYKKEIFTKERTVNDYLEQLIFTLTVQLLKFPSIPLLSVLALSDPVFGRKS